MKSKRNKIDDKYLMKIVSTWFQDPNNRLVLLWEAEIFIQLTLNMFLLGGNRHPGKLNKHKDTVKIRFMTRSISSYLYNALQIQPQKLVQITSNCYAAELQKKI